VKAGRNAVLSASILVVLVGCGSRTTHSASTVTVHAVTGTAPSAAIAGAHDCGRGTAAGAHTSCPFAANVRAAYEEARSSVVETYSPATGRNYRMHCTNGEPHRCTGGNDAVVSFP
jgi:hypothetical protein